jgi:serine/threonine-protein kinase
VAVFICQGCGAEHSSWGGKCPHCGTSETIRLAPATDRLVDRVVKGKFKIIRKLGQGGMGAVYLAEQLGIGHRVAIKFLKAEFSTDAEIARRFLNEAKSYALVAHPNAVAFHDFGQDDEGNLFIAMEYCEGVDLKKVIAEQGRLPLAEAADVVIQVADVLANAHAKGVVHRDLKPENIMIRRGLRGVHAKVLDFGIARLMDAGTKLTVAGAIAGTPRYMSPEQVEGKEVDHRADIYSLGIVLYEVLTGHQPFDGNTIAEILRKQSFDPMPTLASVAPDLDYPALEAVIQKACAKKRDERFPDMASFASALSQALPTQTHIPVSPIPLTNPGIRAVASATPSPTSVTGIAVPGSSTEHSTDRTLVRTGEHAPVPAPPGSAEAVTQVGGVSLPPVAPKSKAPLVVAVGLGLAALAGVGYAVSRPAEGPVTPPPVVKNDPPPVVKNDPPPQDTAALEAMKVLREENARMNLGKGRTEFEVAKLDEAETYLKAVDAESSSAAQAKQLLETIGAIREKLKTAKALRASGQCPQALPVFQSVLALNPKVRDAADGVAACRAGTVDPTME